MRKADIPKAANNELIVEYVDTYSSYLLNYNDGRGIKQLEARLTALEAELMKRQILTRDDIARLAR